MQVCKILIVDDEAQWANMVEEKLIGRKDIDIVVRHRCTLADTRELIKNEFFHVALVDLQLVVHEQGGKSIRRNDGIDVLNDLCALRPSCRRILMTANYTNESFRHDILNAFRPTNRTAERLIIKDDFDQLITNLLIEFERRWLRAPIRVAGLAQVVEELKRRPGIQWGSDDSEQLPSGAADRIRVAAYPSEEEIDYLISRVFGQGSEMWKTPEERPSESAQEREMRKLYERLSEPTSEDVASVDIAPVGEGQSSSLVLFAVPELKNGNKGVNCIIKVGPIQEIREEYRRFCRFVRFRKSSERRVELLGYEEGDTLGALCLSNAGGSESIKPPSLEMLFQGKSLEAIRCLNILHDPKNQDWYGTSGAPKGLCAYWHDAYPWKERRSQPIAVRDWLRIDAREFAVQMDAHLLTLESAKLGIPENVLSDGLFQRNWPTCIVHGDLHGGNIMVGGDARPIFIDYRNVGIGPRCMDFAALESSVRLSMPAEDGPAFVKQIVDWSKRERAVLQRVWHNGKKHPNNPDNYWQQISILLGELAQQNFESLTAQEYCAACILWCLRIFSNRRFSAVQKRRLVVWVSELYQYLERRK